MQQTDHCFHNLEWPVPGARLAGPVVWLRGWVVGKPGHDCIDVRVCHKGQTHLGVLGLPRPDLAAHFKSTRAWLPAEFILGVPVTDGPVELTIEVMDAHGGWHALPPILFTIASDGEHPPRMEGRLENSQDGTWTVRDAHHPFHGHLDDPGPTPTIQCGRIPIFGWLLNETRPIATVLATTDTLIFNHLDHSLTDDALAIKVPQHDGARHARLRGMIDYPVTLIPPACLRVYARSDDGSVQLCFAQRIQAKPAATRISSSQHAVYPRVNPRPLPNLPSNRPRRLLFVVRSLLPDEATLRALDLARNLISSHRWAARLIAAEDGPLRNDFSQAGVETLVLDPGPLLAAQNADAMQRALNHLGRQVLWNHLDAVVIFDPVCGWISSMAKRQKIPVLFDCVSTTPMEPDSTAIPEVQALFRSSWQTATAVCFASEAAARAQTHSLGQRPAAIIPHWHSPNLPTTPLGREPFCAHAPLRTVSWLRQHHSETAARWRFRQGPAGLIADESRARLDDAFNGNIEHSDSWSVEGLSLCLGPLFGRGPLRPIIDAAAVGIPVVAPKHAITEELFGGFKIPLVDEANPLALAHALLTWDSLPDSYQKEASAMAPLSRINTTRPASSRNGRSSWPPLSPAGKRPRSSLETTTNPELAPPLLLCLGSNLAA